jgi:hypothetical protein
VILILQNRNVAFAVWDEGQPEPEPTSVESAQLLELDSSSNQDQPSAQEGSSPMEQIAGSSSPDEQSHSFAATGLYSESLDETSSMMSESEQPGVRMRVSSSHLILASPYFKRMLRGDWKEACTLRAEGRLTIYVEEDWDPDALLILMNIIHGHTRKVTRTVSLEMLAKLAVLVDYYQCPEVVEVFSEMWINQLKGTLPETYSRDLILWICISWVFHQSYEFEVTTGIALMQSEGPMQTLRLPIPKIIVGRFAVRLRNTTPLTTRTEKIDQQRQESIDQIITALHDLLDGFRESREPCSFECDSILLGALTKQMHTRGLFSPRPALPLLGFNFATTAKSIRDIHSPVWISVNDSRKHKCRLPTRIHPIIDRVEKGMKGLALKDISLLEVN